MCWLLNQRDGQATFVKILYAFIMEHSNGKLHTISLLQCGIVVNKSINENSLIPECYSRYEYDKPKPV